MTTRMAIKIQRRIRESGYMLANEFTHLAVDAAGECSVELWQTRWGANGRCAIFRTPEEWSAFATMRGERRIGMAFAGAR